MHPRRSVVHTKLQTPSSPPPNTVGAAVNPFHLDDEEDDICPVCDGECTCHNNIRAMPLLPLPTTLPTTPLTMSQLSALHAASSQSRSHLSTPTPTPVPTAKPLLPSLKIKLTVPQSLLGKRRAPPPSSSKKSKNPTETTFAAETDGDHPGISSASTSALNPKRRGRPPKALAAARQTTHAAPTLQSHPRQSLTKPKKSAPRPSAPLKSKPPVKKQATAKRRRVVSSGSSDLSDLDHTRYAFHDGADDDDDDDSQSVQFPTFVSASVLSSRASSSSASDSSDLSSFGDSDSEMEAEEENFIVSEIHDRARVRRELLGDEPPKKRDAHNAWVIRPRKKSVGPSDVEMDVDTDATEDADEDDDDDPPAAEEEETDGRGSTGAGYVGVATGWSEDDDDESSFDADLFFANLSDSDLDHATSDESSDGDDGDESDMDSMELSTASLTAPPPDSLAFEVTEGWDGQIMFTNGLSEGQGMLDMDFEHHAAQFAETSPSPSQESADVEMSSDIDDGGYEEDADEGEGETTDEELVGEDDLPNERAMRLFSLPFSVSAINPMSTMSPAVSPGPRDRRPFTALSLDSPKPADILSGKTFWDSDDHDEFEDNEAKRYSSLTAANLPGFGPRRGHFEPVKETRQAIIDDSHKAVPSPHPRFRRRRPSVEHLLKRHLNTFMQSPTSASGHSPFPLLQPSGDEIGLTTPEMAAGELVDLNELLEASFLDQDPSDSQSTSTEHGEPRKPVLRSFNRWDLIPVGAFRQSRELAEGWSSDTPGCAGAAAATDYGSMMKSSPLSTMLWQNKARAGGGGGGGQRGAVARSRKMSVVISPVILPVRDGDRTPTNVPLHASHHQHQHQQPPPLQRDHNYPHKSRKELRRERKLKRKSYGNVQQKGQHNQHHSHHHHPNSKSRSSSSAQRSGFFMSSVPPFSL